MAADQRQFRRMTRALAAFPDLPALPSDHVDAAGLAADLRARSVVVSASQALTWVVVKRHGAKLWTTQPRWWRLADHGAPIWLKSAAVPH